MFRQLKPLLPLLAIIALGLVINWGLRHFVLENNSGQALSASTESLFASQFPDSRGVTQGLSQWKGKILVINFWASWCPPCREEMPELAEIYTRYQTRNVMVIGIAAEELAKMLAYAQTAPMPYPLLAGDLQAMGLSEQLGNGPGALPYTVIIDPTGNTVTTYTGRISALMLTADIENLLKKFPPKNPESATLHPASNPP